MARIHSVKKARKEQGKCGRCGTKIKAGMPYRWTQRRFNPKQIRCASGKCDFRESELTGAKYSAVLGAKEDALEAIMALTESTELSDFTTVLDDVKSAAEEVASEYRDSADNVREAFSESENADQWEEYADELESWADGLEDVNVDEYDEFSDNSDPTDKDEIANDWREQVIDEIQAKLDEFPYPQF